ncbi:MAG TPA: hypothetical protein PK047_07070 [Saprospiraceae bacterium]|jgi:hypothetical protein|nr:hypothetical protein [Saprospiraceae bacterium]HRO08613.1 hypothetical protein [Saprospiraceae bacterium]HRP42192.1 hypothetical protein [Saprospiraceae bacterium]
MKSNVFIIVVIFFLKNTLFSQTYIGPSLGIDLSQISGPNELKPYFEITGSMLSTLSFSYGILIEQPVTSKSIISMRSIFTKKKSSASTSGIVAIDKIQYFSNKNSIEFKYFPYKNWNVGAGFNVGFGRNQMVTYLSSSGQKYKFTETGLVFSSGIIVNKILLELLYYHSFALKYKIEPALYKIEPTKSLVISASYLFKVREKSKSQKIECPRF